MAFCRVELPLLCCFLTREAHLVFGLGSGTKRSKYACRANSASALACGVCDERSPRNKAIKIEILGRGGSFQLPAPTKQDPRNLSLSVQGATQDGCGVPGEGTESGAWSSLGSSSSEPVKLVDKGQSLPQEPKVMFDCNFNSPR